MTYDEVNQAYGNDTLRQRVRVAIIITANNIRAEDPQTANHAQRLSWAVRAFANPEGEINKILWCVLAQNIAATLAAVTGASDAAIQSAVDTAVPTLLQ